MFHAGEFDAFGTPITQEAALEEFLELFPVDDFGNERLIKNS